MRSQCVAIYYFILNAVGFFIGPSSVALLTDYYFHDESQLRYSMFIVALSVSIYGFALLIYNLPHFRAAAREAKANAAAGG
jgi:MFS family permease